MEKTKNVSKEWYNWTISKQMWKMVRPFIKLLQDEYYGLGYEYSISECYEKLCLSMKLTRPEFIKMDIALRNVADELESFEYELKNKVLEG